MLQEAAGYWSIRKICGESLQQHDVGMTEMMVTPVLNVTSPIAVTKMTAWMEGMHEWFSPPTCSM